MQISTDQTHMARALTLAELGRYSTSPNPMVGCVIVQNGKVVGEGYHHKAGEAHAEVIALHSAGDNSHGATAYVTLEPCCHYGRTPPCTDALINAGIKKVVIASIDPNPLVSGKGIDILKNAGIEVVYGLLEFEAINLNETYRHYITTKRPFVIAKWAMSLDGQMTTHPEDSKAISGEISHQRVHQTRHAVDAILVGKNTAAQDNPLLTVRMIATEIKKQPTRVLLTSRCDMPLDLEILNTDSGYKTIVMTTDQASKQTLDTLTTKGIHIIVVERSADNQVDLNSALIQLGKLGIASLLVEGGRKMHESFFQAGLVNKLDMYLAPVVIGKMKQKLIIEDLNTNTDGRDYYFSGYVTSHH